MTKKVWNGERKIHHHFHPMKIEDCVAPDITANSLIDLSGKLNSIGIILCVLISIFGFIISISSATNPITSYISDEESSFITFITGIGITVALAIIVYYLFHAFSLLLEAIAKITFNTKVTAKLTELNTIYSIGDEDVKDFESNTSSKKVDTSI